MMKGTETVGSMKEKERHNTWVSQKANCMGEEILPEDFNRITVDKKQALSC